MMAQTDRVVVGIDVAKDKADCMHSLVVATADFPKYRGAL